jgi:antirestriction protein ArdC
MNATNTMAAVVARLVDAIEAGATDWHMPWRTLGATGWPTNAATGNRYTGGNVIALYLAAADRQYPNARWATYKQWQTLDAHVRKNERGTLGIFWKITDHQPDIADDDNAETVEPRQRSAWARTFTVFNAAQVDGDPQPAEPVDLDPLDRDVRADAFFAAVPAVVRWGSGTPCYRPASDDVVMPAFDALHSAADAYATLAHDPLTAGPAPEHPRSGAARVVVWRRDRRGISAWRTDQLSAPTLVT